MKNIILFLGFTMLMSFIACDIKDFTPIVEVDIPPHTPLIVIRADWSAGDDSLAVFVSKSRGVLDTARANFSQTFINVWNNDTTKYVQEYYDTVPNTKVELLRNGQLLGTIPYFNKGYHVAKKLFKLDTISGTTYTIRVSAPGFATVEASQKIQNRFAVLRGGYKAKGAVYSDPTDPFSSPEKGDELTIELQDNGNDANYYAIEYNNTPLSGGFSSYNPVVIFRDTLNKTYAASVYKQDLDPTIENGFLPDRVFNGKNYIWRIWLSPYYYFTNQTDRTSPRQFNETQLKSGDRIRLRIRSTNKDYVLFLKTLELARDAQDNPFFTEPVILHSNVKNGYGIFTIGSVQDVSFVIP